MPKTLLIFPSGPEGPSAGAPYLWVTSSPAPASFLGRAAARAFEVLETPAPVILPTTLAEAHKSTFLKVLS